MHSRSMAAGGCLVAVLGFGVAACGSDSPDTKSPEAATTAKSVTIYSSYPLQGAGRAQSEAWSFCQQDKSPRAQGATPCGSAASSATPKRSPTDRTTRARCVKIPASLSALCQADRTN